MVSNKCEHCFSYYCDRCKDDPMDNSNKLLTYAQQDKVCYLIGEWYLKWKSQFKGEHPLGIAKEELKQILCDYEA